MTQPTNQCKIQFRVRYQETDNMGFVHHSVYFIWYEVGRTEWMRQFGLTYRECEEKGWLMPLIEGGSKYIHPARYDDLVEVETALKLEKGAVFRFEYTVINVSDQTLLASGFTRHVCIDKENKINKAATKYLQQSFKSIVS
jgi:acyl-CoA thioester hydrolase